MARKLPEIPKLPDDAIGAITLIGWDDEIIDRVVVRERPQKAKKPEEEK